VCGAFGTFAHQPYAARLRKQLSSNYKGFPLCQASKSHGPRQRPDPHLTLDSSTYSFTVLLRKASMLRARVRTDKLQPVIDAAWLLRTLMKDARGGLIR